jgi:tetratricopeptide (TPR) repeat protein
MAHVRGKTPSPGRRIDGRAAGPSPHSARWAVLAAGGVIVAVALAYSGSFDGPFIFDDVESIPDNPHIRSLWPITEAVRADPQQTVSGRPVLSLSLAATYAVWGLDVRGYHAVNLAIHLAACLALFGVVCEVLRCPRLAPALGRNATPVAFAVALLWGLHPLQTQAVTYIVQRAESLAGLFYLLTTYCAVRSFRSRRGWAWCVAAVAACGLGMGTKETMATAPLMVLAFDLVLQRRSFRELLARRWPLYAALAATWAILAAPMLTGARSVSAGFGVSAISPADYARCEFGVILHYLRLALLPVGLTFDYMGWTIPAGSGLYLPAAAVAILLAATVVALRFRPAAGLLGLWFFLILAPTSSFVPLADVAFEHRMYLPSSAVVAGAVVAVWLLLRRFAGGSGRRWRVAAVGEASVLAVAAVTLGALTYERNEAYDSRLAIWQDTTAKMPRNNRAQNELGLIYAGRGEYDLAMRHYDRAIVLRDDDADVHVNRGTCLARAGRDAEALADFSRAIELNAPRLARREEAGGSIPPNLAGRYAAAYNDRGIVLRRMGRIDEALADFSRALKIRPGYVEAVQGRAATYIEAGRFGEAVDEASRAIAGGADEAALYDVRGVAYYREGLYGKAEEDFARAVRLAPGDESYRRHLEAIRQLALPETRPAHGL